MTGMMPQDSEVRHVVYGEMRDEIANAIHREVRELVAIDIEVRVK